MDTNYVGNQLVNNQAVAERKTWSLTTTQSVFPVRYDTGDVDVYKNGQKLRPGIDYTVNLVTRDSITLAVAGVNGDFIEIIGWNGYSVAEPPKFIRSKFIHTAVAPVTTYSCGYLSNHSEVFVNGVKLILNDDYTGIDGTSVTLVTPLGIGDTIEVDVYESFSVVDLNARLAQNQSYTRTDFIATAGQTTFNVAYTPGFLQVYQNGVLLQTSDYTATNTTSVVLAVGANVNDEISIVTWNTFSIGDVIRKSGDTMAGPLTLNGDPTNNLHASTKQYVDAKFPVSYANLGSDSKTSMVSFRNKIINGACRVAQRGSVAISNNTFTYGGVDRIACYLTGFTTASGTLSQGEWGNGYGQYFTLTSTGSGSVQFHSRLESFDVAVLNGKQVTISADVFQNTGAAVNARIYLFKPNALDDHTTSTGLANSAFISIPNNAATHISATFTLGASDATNGLTPLIAFEGVGAVTGINFGITKFQLVEGSIDTPFEYPPLAVDQMLCQRYYQRVKVELQSPAIGSILYAYNFPVPMRVQPTLTNNTAGTLSAATVANSAATSSYSGYFQITASDAGGYVTNRIENLNAEL